MTIEERREKILHPKLEQICENVYFQPPPNVHLKYPAIIYSRDSDDVRYADDESYILRIRYSVTVITPDPCDAYIEEFRKFFAYVRFDRHFTHDNLNHNVFTIFF